MTNSKNKDTTKMKPFVARRSNQSLADWNDEASSDSFFVPRLFPSLCRPMVPSMDDDSLATDISSLGNHGAPTYDQEETETFENEMATFDNEGAATLAVVATGCGARRTRGNDDGSSFPF